SQKRVCSKAVTAASSTCVAVLISHSLTAYAVQREHGRLSAYRPEPNSNGRLLKNDPFLMPLPEIFALHRDCLVASEPRQAMTSPSNPKLQLYPGCAACRWACLPADTGQQALRPAAGILNRSLAPVRMLESRH